MDTMLKRLLSLAVALVMVIGLMPWNAASVYATEAVPEETEAPAETEPEQEETVHTHADCECCTTEGVEWIAWDGTVAALKGGGHFYVAEEVLTVNATLDGSHGNVTICLNGNTLKSSGGGRIFHVKSGANLTIVDCTASGTLGTDYEAGKIEFAAATISRGAFVYCNGGTFAMYDGIVEGGNASCNTDKEEYGGLIQAIGASKVYINGGWLRNYTAYQGGAIYVNGTAEVEMTGGYISGCAAGDQGGAIYVTDNGNVTISSGTITESTKSAVCATENATLEMSGGGILARH